MVAMEAMEEAMVMATIHMDMAVQDGEECC